MASVCPPPAAACSAVCPHRSPRLSSSRTARVRAPAPSAPPSPAPLSHRASRRRLSASPCRHRAQRSAPRHTGARSSVLLRPEGRAAGRGAPRQQASGRAQRRARRGLRSRRRQRRCAPRRGRGRATPCVERALIITARQGAQARRGRAGARGVAHACGCPPRFRLRLQWSAGRGPCCLRPRCLTTPQPNSVEAQPAGLARDSGARWCPAGCQRPGGRGGGCRGEKRHEDQEEG
jgi:hypothetical protein